MIGLADQRIIPGCWCLRQIWRQIAIGPDVRSVVQLVAEENASFRPSYLDRWHRCQLRAVGGGKSPGSLVRHRLTHIVFHLVFEAIDSFTTSTADPAATISLLGITVRLVCASRSM